MEKVSVSVVKKEFVAFSIVMILAMYNVKAQELLAYSDLKVSNSEIVNGKEELKVNKQVAEIGANIGQYIGKEAEMHLDQYNIAAGKYYCNIDLWVSKTGKILCYELNNKVEPKIDKMLADIISKAPVFEAVKMNGFAVRMHYQIPVTIIVR
ncbi:MAG TPA: hypothetical protein VIO15_08670 [Bacteroidales bacterium]